MKKSIGFMGCLVFSVFWGGAVASASDLESANKHCQVFNSALVVSYINNQPSMTLEVCKSKLPTTNGLQRSASDPGVFG